MTGACLVCGRAAAVAVHDGAGRAGSRAFCGEHAPLAVFLERGGPVESPADLGAILLREGEVQAARAALERAAREGGPPRATVLELLARARERTGDLPGAIEAQRRAAEAAPGEGDRRAALGRLLAVAGDMGAARAAFEAGFAADPFSFECCRRAAVLAIAGREAERAVELLERFLAETGARGAGGAAGVVPVDPARRPATAADLGGPVAYAEALRPIESRRAHVVAANRYRARVLLGDALRSLGRDEEAEAQLRAAPAEVAGLPPALLGDAGLGVG